MERKALLQTQKQKPANEEENVIDNLMNELRVGVPLRRRTLRKHQASMRASRRTVSMKDKARLQAMCASAAEQVTEQNPVT